MRRGLVLLTLLAASFAQGCATRGGGEAGAGGGAAGPSSSPQQAASRPSPALAVREVESPAGPETREPELSAASGGRVLLSWVEKTGERRHALRFATRDARGWGETRTAAEGDNWFVNWADFPSVVELADGSLAAHWLVKSGAGTYAYDVNLSRSADGGKTWGAPVVPHTDHTETEHGFVSLLALGGGRLGAVWVDGRDMKDQHGDAGGHGPPSASMTLRYAEVGADGRLAEEALLDGRICECCQTSAAVTEEGPLVVYRGRTAEEVRDIQSIRKAPGGWGAPRAVHADNWRVAGCPVNGPAVAAEGRRAAVAWYTAEGDSPRVNVAFSADAGATFGPAVRVDDGDVVGRADVVLLADGSALVCWMSGAEGRGAVKVRRIAADGAAGPVAVVSEADVPRSGGFPRMARAGGTVYFAWTQFGKPPRVRTAAADVAAFR
ncbi:MAG TPA: sialidase family protein [Pyrinomonadaceae bacterium]|jgi:hypothetical protein